MSDQYGIVEIRDNVDQVCIHSLFTKHEHKAYTKSSFENNINELIMSLFPKNEML